MIPKDLFFRAATILLLVLALAACGTSNSATRSPQGTYTAQAPTPTFALATPYAQQPAAGICASVDAGVVTITINVDAPSPRCARVLPDQTLTVVNKTLNTVQVSIGRFSSSILPGAAYTITVPFGDYLAPGVHQLTVTKYFSAELWLESTGG